MTTNPVLERAIQNSMEVAQASMLATRTKTGALIPLHQTIPIKDIGNAFTIWCMELPTQYVIADILQPGLWRHIEILLRQRGPRRPKPNDLLRIIRNDTGYDTSENFDAIFRIDQVQEGVGYFLTFYAGLLPQSSGEVQ
jgi:hypothetical protein